MKYLNWKEEKIENDSPEIITKMYDNGFVFTRLEKGIMQQTRSIRIDLGKFEISSENRRILKKGEKVIFEEHSIPYSAYTWEIGKMAKNFYDEKTDHAFSANKIKEILTTNHNFNSLLSYSGFGYTICYKNNSMMHYCYPFYNLETTPKNMGMIMMIKAILEAKTLGLKYVYLGSLQRPSDTYKLQFSGIEWFDGENWSEDLEEVKEILGKAV